MQEKEELRPETDDEPIRLIDDDEAESLEIPEETVEETSEGEASAPETVEEPIPETEEEKKFRRCRGLFEYVETFSIALASLIVVFLFLCRYVAVDGDSMFPTLHGEPEEHTEIGKDHMDKLLISDFLYHPKTGDIVVVNVGDDAKPLIKRVIATGGQTVTINFNTWEVTVDGVKLNETYINYTEHFRMNEADMNFLYGVDADGVCSFTVGEGKVFVMGDNRNNSRDSRFASVGEQDESRILGKVILRLFPMSEFGAV